MEPETETALATENSLALRSLEELLQSQEFIIAAIFGAAVVIFDAMRRYNQNVFGFGPQDVIFSITPKYLSTHSDYFNSMVVYITMRLLSYALPALAILHIFSDKGMTQALGVALPDHFAAFITHHNFPLFWGAVIAGVLPSFSFIDDIERAIRRFAHLTGSIPTGVKRLAALLRLAPLRPGRHFERTRLKAERFSFLTEADFERSQTPIDRKWARAAFIIDFLFDQRDRAVVQDAFLAEYKADIQREENRFRSLQIRYALYKVGYERVKEIFSAENIATIPKTIASHDPYLEDDIDYLLERLEIYLACTIRYSANNEAKAMTELRDIGFMVPETVPPPSGPIGSILATATALILATFIGALSSDIVVGFTSDILEITEFPYAVAPGDSIFQRAFGLLTYTLFIVASVLFGSFLVGPTVFKISRTEIERRPFTARPLLNYAAASILGALCGLMALTAKMVDPNNLTFGAYSWIWYWFPSFFVLGFLIHLFAYGPQTSHKNLFYQCAIIGFGFGFSTYISALPVFSFFGFEGPHLDGAALYFSIGAFWTGLFASAAMIYVHRSQRDAALNVEREIKAALQAARIQDSS